MKTKTKYHTWVSIFWTAITIFFGIFFGLFILWATSGCSLYKQVRSEPIKHQVECRDEAILHSNGNLKIEDRLYKNCLDRKRSWSKKDITREGLWIAAHIIDWKQTEYAAEHSEKFKELNPFLGENPSRGRINTFMGVVLIGHTLISNWLKEKKKAWQNITLGIKVGVTLSNYYVGTEVEF